MDLGTLLKQEGKRHLMTDEPESPWVAAWNSYNRHDQPSCGIRVRAVDQDGCRKMKGLGAELQKGF